MQPSGSKSWTQRITINGRRTDIGFGGHPAVSLAQARAKATANRALVAAGLDPVQEKRKAKSPTFEVATRKVFEANMARWRNGKHTKSWLQSMERHAFPILGDMPVDEIGREDVLRTLVPIWTVRQETARRVRQRIRTVLRWAMAHGYRDDNPAGEAIDGALPAMPKLKAHLRALPYRDVPAALAAVDATQATPAAKLCFRFTVLTAARSGEARGSTWAEIDWDTATWIIPGSRMKAAREHRVPLSDAAMAVLEQAKALDDDSALVFPSALRRGKPMSDMTILKLVRGVGLPSTLHGFRSSFRDWCAESGRPRELAEAALAHTVQGVEAAYFRSDLIEQRRTLMQSWADFLSGRIAGKVVRLHGYK